MSLEKGWSMEINLRRLLLSILSIALWATWALPARGQDECEQLLIEADSAFQIGRLEEALESLEKCLTSDPTRAARVPVFALKAKVQLELDDREAAAETILKLLQLVPGYRGDPLRDPPLFLSMVDELRQADTTVTVRSVSKTPEELRRAPATVAVVTAEEIERRGYLDLEALLHDLPGFDLSRSHGLTYSNAYQRGLRTAATTRTLLLIDGVEENDLRTGVAHLSRQIPLSNVERVEVVYGPASSIYGSGAFGGVIQVITKLPEEAAAEGAYGGQAQVAAGSFGTGYLDAILADQTRGGRFGWTLTGRIFRSAGHDLSRFPEWDYDGAAFEAAGYRRLLRIAGEAGVASFQDFLAGAGLADCSGRPGCEYAAGGGSVELTAAGVGRAAELDRAAYRESLGGRPPAFSNPTEDWSLNGKIRISGVELGFQSWRREEAPTPSFTDLTAPGGDNGALWIPRQNRFYGKYHGRLGQRSSFVYGIQFKEHRLDGGSFLPSLSAYANGLMDLEDLLGGRQASWSGLYHYSSSNQLVNELTVTSVISDHFTLVGGVEVRESSIAATTIRSPEENPAATGRPAPGILGGNQFDVRDLALYLQATYRPWEERPLQLVFGGRLDDNQVRESDGYGRHHSPRLAVVYTPGDVVLKAIYSHGFQDATLSQKYLAAEGRQLANPGLGPETVDNLELSASWRPSERLALELAAYRAETGDVIRLTEVPCPAGTFCFGDTISQYRGAGELEIRGVQASASFQTERYTFFGNYTYADPRDTSLDLAVGDVARHRLNLGANAAFFGRRLNLNLRANHVGSRRTGAGTTVVANPLTEIDAYTVAHLTVGYKNRGPERSAEGDEGVWGRFLHGAGLDLIVNNLFDEDYFHPGVGDADGIVYASRLPQPERHALLRLSLSF